ncbi:unnamed protein product [Penicillium glandicola]
MSTEHRTDILHTVNLVTQCLCIPVVTIFIALRFYTRFRFKQSLGLEDLGEHGGGYPLAEWSAEDAVAFKKFCYIATILYCPMALFVKVALLSILTRIFAPYRSKVWFIHIFLGCLCCYYIVALIVKIRICDPIPRYWLGDSVEGTCLDQTAALIADSVISVVSDLIILILPLPLTWSLQMSRNRKLRVIGLLSAGGLATAFSLYRLVLVLKGSSDAGLMFVCVILSGYVMHALHLNAEAGVGLICACLPVLNVMLAHYKKTYSSQKYYQNGGSTHPLSERKSAPGSNVSPDWDKTTTFGDQSHLISFAGPPEAGESSEAVESIYNEGGIRRTVAVSQTVETS